MRPVLFSILILCTALPGAAQWPDRLLLPNPILHRRYEFSSAAVRGDTVFLFSEKCDTYFRCRVNAGQLQVLPGGVCPMRRTTAGGRVEAIEGAVWHKGRILLADEGLDGRGPQVWQYWPDRDRIAAVNGVPKMLNYNDTNGLEGIAVKSTPDGDYCYLLREKDGTGSSWIYTSRIRANAAAGTLSLALVPGGKAVIPNRDTAGAVSWNCRYSDIWYDVATDALFCLRSCYDKNDSTRNSYRIDGLPLGPDHLPQLTRLR